MMKNYLGLNIINQSLSFNTKIKVLRQNCFYPSLFLNLFILKQSFQASFMGCLFRAQALILKNWN